MEGRILLLAFVALTAFGVVAAPTATAMCKDVVDWGCVDMGGTVICNMPIINSPPWNCRPP